MKVQQDWKRYGLGSVSGYIAYRLTRRLVDLHVTRLMWLDLRQLPPTPQRHDRDRIERLTAEQLADAAVSHPALELSPELGQRVLAGLDHCFGIYRRSQLIAYYWLAQQGIEAEHNRAGGPQSGVALSFADDVIYGYKAFVLPDHRGAGLYGDLVSEAARWMQQHHGARHLISTVDWTNFAALRSCQRQGMQSLGKIARIGWRGHYRTWTSRSLQRFEPWAAGDVFDGSQRLGGGDQRRRVAPLDLRIGDTAIVPPRTEKPSTTMLQEPPLIVLRFPRPSKST